MNIDLESDVFPVNSDWASWKPLTFHCLIQMYTFTGVSLGSEWCFGSVNERCNSS